MKLNRFTQWLGLFGLALGGLLLAGCSSVSYQDPNPSKPYVFPSQRPPATDESPAGHPPAVSPAAVADAATPRPASTPAAAVTAVETPVSSNPPPAAAPTGPGPLDASYIVLHKGDFVTVTFSDTPTPLPEHKERIRDDGNMTLIYNVTVKADGKTAGELQGAIREALVPKYFKYLTVTVKAEDRFYFVGGEVRNPSRQIYAGNMTVLRAIDTAQGFTDFANRKRIELRRANGKLYKLDWNKAIKDPKLDLDVYPNDQIIVHKRSI